MRGIAGRCGYHVVPLQEVVASGRLKYLNLLGAALADAVAEILLADRQVTVYTRLFGNYGQIVAFPIELLVMYIWSEICQIRTCFCCSCLTVASWLQEISPAVISLLSQLHQFEAACTCIKAVLLSRIRCFLTRWVSHGIPAAPVVNLDCD